ncbi:MAG: thioredoxin [Acidimicrobiia bacterium]
MLKDPSSQSPSLSSRRQSRTHSCRPRVPISDGRNLRSRRNQMALSKLTDADFRRDVENAEGRVVVDFYADWCGPCHQVAPALEELSSKWEGDIRFVKVDIDESPQLAQAYRVFSIPTIMLFEGGKVVAHTMGARPAHAIEHELGLAEHAA